MANKVDRILESIKATTGIDSYDSIIKTYGVLDLKPTPKKQAKDMSPVYCYCSAGWFEKLFSSILGDSVKVNKIQ